MKKKIKKPKTKAELLSDPRVAKIGEPLIKKESDILWKEEDGSGSFSYWCVLAEGWNHAGASAIHEKTIRGIINQLDFVEEGEPY